MAKPDKPNLSEEIRLTVGGKKYRLNVYDYTGEDDFAVFQKTGLSITDIFSGAVTLFTLGALVWRRRAQREPALTFEEVLRGMTFRDMETIVGNGQPKGGKSAEPEYVEDVDEAEEGAAVPEV